MHIVEFSADKSLKDLMRQFHNDLWAYLYKAHKPVSAEWLYTLWHRHWEMHTLISSLMEDTFDDVYLSVNR